MALKGGSARTTLSSERSMATLLLFSCIWHAGICLVHTRPSELALIPLLIVFGLSINQRIELLLDILESAVQRITFFRDKTRFAHKNSGL